MTSVLTVILYTLKLNLFATIVICNVHEFMIK